MRAIRSVTRAAAAILVVLALAVACWSPTEVQIDASTDYDCTSIQTGIFLGSDPGATALAVGCPEGGARDGFSAIGSFVVAPSGSRDASVDVKVILSDTLGVSPERCLQASLTPDPKSDADRATLQHCVIARRSFRFDAHQSEFVGVRLYRACAGVVCDPSSTCEPSPGGGTICSQSAVALAGGMSDEKEPGDANPFEDAALDASVDVKADTAPPGRCTGPNGDGILTTALPTPITASPFLYDANAKRLLALASMTSGVELVAADVTTGAVSTVWAAGENAGTVAMATAGGGDTYVALDKTVYRVAAGTTMADNSWTASTSSTVLDMSVGGTTLYVADDALETRPVGGGAVGFVTAAYGANALLVGATPQSVYWATANLLGRFSSAGGAGSNLAAKASRIVPQAAGAGAFVCGMITSAVPDLSYVPPTGSPTTITSSIEASCVVALDPSDDKMVYWVQAVTDIWRGKIDPLTGNVTTSPVYQPAKGPTADPVQAVASDGTCVYFTTPTTTGETVHVTPAK
ncbi:MAG TPA: hypothetical protein VIF62_32920 [Labilithrix sp.]